MATVACASCTEQVYADKPIIGNHVVTRMGDGRILFVDERSHKIVHLCSWVFPPERKHPTYTVLICLGGHTTIAGINTIAV